MKWLRLLTSAFTLLVLSGCDDSEPAREPQEAGSSWTAGERNQYPFGLACGWELASNIDTMNIAFPDESAKYWLALVPMLPGSRLRIDGRYPDARYFSYNVYDPILRPTEALADQDIMPLNGSVNPFAVEGFGAPRGDGYTAYVEFSAKPESPYPNTLYAGEMHIGDAGIPQPALTALIYRVYVPGEGHDFDGGVGLPLLTLETANGETELLPAADCVEPLLPTLGNTIPDLALNEILEGIDFIDDPFLAAPGAIPIGDPTADTHVFYGLPTTAFSILRNLLGLPIPEGIEDQLPLPAGGGFLSNLHNAYTSTLFTRNYGNVVMIRAKAPSYRSQDAVGLGNEQLRYWSVCQNDLPSQRYVACVADYQAHLDEDGYFTVMVSDPADRPANAVVENAIDWLPWGPYIDATVIYRHMLPSPDFAEAIHNVPQGTPPIEIMREYLPIGAYCQRQIVEDAGDDVSAIFAACRQYTEGLSRGLLGGS